MTPPRQHALSCGAPRGPRRAPGTLGPQGRDGPSTGWPLWRAAAALAFFAPLGAGAQAPGAPPAPTAAPKASAASSSIEAAYQRERAACLSGQTNQDRSTCLQEAAAARDDALRRGATAPPSDPDTLRANALRRCEAFTTPDDRERCARMARGEGTRSGSAADGGVIKELRTVEPGPPPAAK